MAYTDTARILAEMHGLDDFPVVDEERGSRLHGEVIRFPADYERHATLVLVALNREVEHMTCPELERALFAGVVISVEAFPAPTERWSHIVRIHQGGARVSDTGYLRLPGDDRPGQELARLFEAVTNPSHPSDTPESVWGVSHYTPSQFPVECREALASLSLYGEGDEPAPDRVSDAVDDLYA